MTADDRDRRKCDGGNDTQPHPLVCVLRVQVSPKWHRDDRRECECVVISNESTRPPDPRLAQGGDREQASLDCVEADRSRYYPDQREHMLPAMEQHQHDERADLDL